MKISQTIKDFKKIKKIGLKEKLIILSLLLFSFLLGLGGSILLISTKSAPAATIAHVPAKLTLATTEKNITAGRNFDVTINLSSPQIGVEAADFVLDFDPKFVKPTSITPGNYFKNYPVKRIDKNFIKISATASFINNKIIIPKGDGVAATITFQAIAPSQNTTISFDPAKTIVASDGKNIVDNITSLNLSIK